MLPVGPLIDCGATFTGAVIGASLGHKIPRRLKEKLPLIFGAASMALGIIMINKIHIIPAVILALLLGSIIGELLKIESNIEKVAKKIQVPIQRIFASGGSDIDEQTMLLQFVSVLVLFSASGTGIFGALNEGITHDTAILVSKAFLDFFTAAIFGASIGYIVATTVIPQFIILVGLYYLSHVIVPLTTDEMIQDFSACGGIIMLVTGFRICNIKNFPIANMLPALVLVLFVSHYWGMFF